MAAREQFVVISYDIADAKRRLRVAKMLLDHGGLRVQLSVFECYITAAHLVRLRARLAKAIDARQDSVRFYALCESCRPRIEYMGRAHPIDEPGLIII